MSYFKLWKENLLDYDLGIKPIVLEQLNTLYKMESIKPL